MAQSLSAAALAVSCAACRDPKIIPASLYSGVVYGVVKNGSNLPLGSVQVESELYLDACTTSLKTGASSPVLTTTDAAGRFRQQILTWNGASGQCVRVIAHPTTSSPVAVEATGLRVKAHEAGSTRDDSIRVDVVVPEGMTLFL
jgi:hypothetical protein